MGTGYDPRNSGLFPPAAAKNRVTAFLLAGCWFAFSPPSLSQPADTRQAVSDWSVHFQQTVVVQGHPSFEAPYSGRNSLSPSGETRTSFTSTLFLAKRLWAGAGLYFNPEVAGGSGLSGTTGVAGFPNGEIYRVDNPRLKVYPARIFLRQTVALSEEFVSIEDGANMLGDSAATTRLVFTAGKISLLDIFDDNRYSHEPRTDFLNWALMGNGAWDYPADTRGYTWAFAAEYVRPGWAARLAAATLPTAANGPDFDWNLARAHGEALEFEWRDAVFATPNAIRLFVYHNTARMGSYPQAVAAGSPPDIVPTRAYGRTRYGFGMNGELSLTPDLGVFMRLGWSDGKNETWAFTEIDRTISGGCVLNGRFLQRPADRIGVAVVVNGLSDPHREYLAAGGYGFIIGDGALRYGAEVIVEAFCAAHLAPALEISADYQFFLHPAYNKDRGPVHVFAGRVHVEL